MANLVDSQADFKAAVVKMGLGPVYAKFEEKNWLTFANFAFASSAQPGAQDETQFMKDVITPLLGEAEALRPAVRRLYWTAHTYVTADMKGDN